MDYKGISDPDKFRRMQEEMQKLAAALPNDVEDFEDEDVEEPGTEVLSENISNPVPTEVQLEVVESQIQALHSQVNAFESTGSLTMSVRQQARTRRYFKKEHRRLKALKEQLDHVRKLERRLERKKKKTYGLGENTRSEVRHAARETFIPKDRKCPRCGKTTLRSRQWVIGLDKGPAGNTQVKVLMCLGCFRVNTEAQDIVAQLKEKQLARKKRRYRRK